jgi:hypothetical protein
MTTMTPETNAFTDWREAFLQAREHLPETVELPPDATPEGRRKESFRSICDPEFCKRIERDRLPNPAAFDAVALWDGTYPGRLATGRTDTAKTRAAWSALGRLYVHHDRRFTWYPVRTLIMKLEQEEKQRTGADFFKNMEHYHVLFIDDLDKINWQFESHKEHLFAFYDWIYRMRRPCLTTTNKDRGWWAKMMGDAFARRLFQDAHTEVKF